MIPDASNDAAPPTTRGLFVTGTDTEVGKTQIACLIVRESIAGGHAVGAYKPVCSGCRPDAAGRPCWDDAERLSAALEHRFATERICPQRLRAPVAPPVAARLEGTAVDADLLLSGAQWWLGRVDMLVVEGVGGLLSPVSGEQCVADLAARLGYPLIIVARLGLGTINHTLLTVEAARHRNLPVAGIVLNEVTPTANRAAAETNPLEIAARADVPLLGMVPHGRPGGLLRDGLQSRMDWWALAGDAPSR